SFRAADAGLAGLILAAEIMVMVDGQRAAHLVAIVEDGARARLRDIVVGMPERLGVYALRVAQHLPDEIEIVDRMHGDLDARQALEEGPEMPWGGDRQQHIEIHDLSKPALANSVLERKHHGREAELEVDGGPQILPPA